MNQLLSVSVLSSFMSWGVGFKYPNVTDGRRQRRAVLEHYLDRMAIMIDWSQFNNVRFFYGDSIFAHWYKVSFGHK
ncbi:hypothetical protein BLOT_001180 [Blomia tropicalis]|nr:hypothetical protein BLOT_001180 [Blomia tropicalis]